MKPPRFSYARAESLDHAVRLLAEHGDEARILAGGQSLMPTLAMRLSQPSVLIDINRLDALKGIHDGDGTVRIGALARHVEVMNSPIVARHLPLIAEAMPHVAHVAVRNRGTFGGSIALADPAAELPACILALGATLVVERRAAADDPAEEFFHGLYETAREPDEILVEVLIPEQKEPSRCSWSLAAGMAISRSPASPAWHASRGNAGRHPPRLFRQRGNPRWQPCHGGAQRQDIDGGSGRAARGARRRPRADRQYVRQRRRQAPLAARAHAARARGGGTTGEDAMSHEETMTVTLTVNGERVTRDIPVRQHLVDFLRTELGLTGSHIGCEHGICGACSVRVDGAVVRGCLMLAVQADGAEVVTIEGLTESGEIADLQETFVTRNALQCGYCTPGMLITAAELLRAGRPASREEIRAFLSGNYRRCTGYHAIVDAVEIDAQPAAGAEQRQQHGRQARLTRSTGRTATSGRSLSRLGAGARWRDAAPTPTTSRCRAWCTPRSCAARMRTRASCARYGRRARRAWSR